MCKDDSISVFLGTLASMLAKNSCNPLGTSEMLDLLKIVQVENTGGGNYVSAQGLKGLVEKARDYWSEEDRPSVVRHIDAYLKP